MIVYETVKIPITSQGLVTFSVQRLSSVRHIRVKVAMNLTSDTDTFFLFQDLNMLPGLVFATSGDQYPSGANYKFFSDLSQCPSEFIYATPQNLTGSHTFRITGIDPAASLTGEIILSFQTSDGILHA